MKLMLDLLVTGLFALLNEGSKNIENKLHHEYHLFNNLIVFVRTMI
jgi:hypothetical protein